MQARRLVMGSALVAVLVVPTAALADSSYPPPASGSGTVSPSRISVGGCADFGGDGFAPGAAVAVSDNDASRGAATATADGTFSKRLCFGADATPGRHVLRGKGQAAATAPQLRRAGAAASKQLRTVTAILYITGVEQTNTATGARSPGSGASTTDGDTGDRLAFTGLNAIAVAVAGTLLVAVGSWLLLVTERRHRRTRRPA